MDITIDPAALQTIVADALLRQLDATARETLIKQSITHLMSKPTNPNSWGEKRSPLESAFANAVEMIARDIIREEIAKPEVRAIIAGTVTKAFAKALEGQDTMVEEMARSIQSAIKYRER